MDAYELDRVKRDVETIKQALGTESPLGWDYFWMNLVGVPCVGLSSLVCWMIAENPSRYALLVPTAVLLLLLGWLRLRHRSAAGGSAAERREYGSQLFTTLFLVIVAGSILFSAALAGINTFHVGSGMVTMLGIAITLNALITPAYRSVIAGGVLCILFGVSMFVWPDPSSVLLNASILCFVAGPAMALLLMRQLRRCRG